LGIRERLGIRARHWGFASGDECEADWGFANDWGFAPDIRDSQTITDSRPTLGIRRM
jgi:hypothetical protein